MNLSITPLAIGFAIALSAAGLPFAVHGADENHSSSSSAPMSSEVAVRTAGGNINGIVRATAISGFLGDTPHWTTYVHTAYVPHTGNGWAGAGLAWASDPSETILALVDDHLIGLYYDAQRNRESLRIFVSTNKYPAGLTNIEPIMRAELDGYTNSSIRFIHRPPYSVHLEKLLGSQAVRDHEDPKRHDGALLFASDTWPSRLKDVKVQDSNLVVTVEFGTNMLSKIALDKNIRPVWATTNGVSIGSIPTNCVFYSDIVSNKVVTRVVY